MADQQCGETKRKYLIHSQIQLKSATAVFLVALACFGLSPAGRAVSSPPDGGYPGGNTAEGQNALLSLSSGTYNTAVGIYSILGLTDGSFCTGVGAGTLLVNTADKNTATGAGALLSNTNGSGNTANGAFALFSNTTGEANTVAGIDALRSNTEGSANTAIGDAALFSDTTGDDNTATGTAALFFNTGGRNTATGRAALFANTIGIDNTATGYAALENNTEGSSDTALGFPALNDNTEGSNNTAVGLNALANNSSGDANTAVGRSAGVSVTGSGNVCIGQGVQGDAGVDDTTWVRNVNTLTQNFSAGVNDYVTVRLSDGRLGHTAVVSSRRYKEDVKPLAAASEALYALKPVSFRLKNEYDETQALGFGLIAEEVEQVEPALVYCNNNGQAESVRYEMVNAMLLNEFLKEHCKNEEQEKAIAELKSGITALAATVKEQAAQIQKVNAQLDVNKPAPQVVNNP